MRKIVLALGFALSLTAARAEVIKPADAPAHAGQSVTVEGVVSDVHRNARSGSVFIDIGGRYPRNAFTAVIFAADAGKFPDAAGLNGKTVNVTGEVRLFKGKPEIILKDAGQIAAK